jgi:hypothetical protein
LQWLSSVSGVFFKFRKYVLIVSSFFRRMLQLLYLDVSKTDRVLHLSSSPSVALSRCVLLLAPAGHLYDAVAGFFQIEGAAERS